MKIRKKGKQLFAVLLSVATIITTLPSSVVTANDIITEFAGGSGTEADPYLIETKEHLNNVRNDLNAHYKMIADIVFTDDDFAADGVFYNNGKRWSPIGTGTSNAFAGTFDGDKHTITGLQINVASSQSEYAGLFGFARNAKISNIVLVNADVYVKGSYACVGGVAGYTMSTRFNGCESSGTIESSDEAGGIVGYVQGGSITNCHNSATVISSNSGGGIVGATDVAVSKCSNSGNISSIDGSIVGGIVGYLYSGGSVTLSYNTGDISAIENREKQGSPTTFAGGICGESSGEIRNCYNTGVIYAEDAVRYAFAGGIAGSGNVYNCYNAGNVSASASATYYVGAGGIVGDFEQATVNCYYINTCNKGSGRGTNLAVKCTPGDLCDSDTFVGFDFNTIWGFAEGNYYKYPTLRGVDCFVVSETATFNAGSGTKSSPYCIASPKQLHNVRFYLNAHFKLVKDIVFSEKDFEEGGAFYFNGAGWLPIKSPSNSYTYFTGVFDGNGYSICNLQINAEVSTSKEAGLFYQNNGVIKNLGIEGGKISLGFSDDVFGYVGAIAGYNKGTISNCFNTCRVEAIGSTGSGYAGGITGYNYEGIISNCYNTGTVYSSNNSAGGITALNADTIENSFNTGFILAEMANNYSCYAGGICGTNHNIVSDCYNIGYISSEESKGGITALLVDISNPDAKIENSYYLVDDGQSVGVDGYGAIKCKKEHMVQQSTYNGFDFENVWAMPDHSNYLYPVLIDNNMDFIKEVQGVMLLSLPNKTEYYVGLEDLDITGAKIAKIYNDGSMEEIPVELSMVSGYDKTTVGQQTITISYAEETFSFYITNLNLIYDHKLTTDETITLEYKANKDFDFIISDETTAKITNVSSSTITWGSSIKKTSAATISPLKPGYVIVRAIDKTGNVLSKSLLLIEEGNHKMELIETIKKASCTEAGEEKYECAFCGFTEKRYPIALGHKEVIDNKVEPTCIKTGLTEGKHCSHCEEVLIKQKVIDATGVHIWDKGTTDKSGNILYNCDTCDATYSKNLVSIKVTTKPNKLNYFEDENMDFTGMVVTAYYDNNTNAQMTALSAGYSMMEGKQTVTVECYGKTDTFTITVNSRVPSNVTSGDVNADGTVNAQDALMVLQTAVGKRKLNEDQIRAADVDGNVKLDAADALYILQKAVNKILKFPCER